MHQTIRHRTATILLSTAITLGASAAPARADSPKPSYGRGAGSALTCADDEDLDGALCYPRCRGGYKGVGPVCWERDCRGGYQDFGATCTKKSLPFDTYSKGSYGRGAGKAVHTCSGGKQQDGALCYDACRQGYSGAGPVCWGACPAGTTDGGAVCLSAKTTAVLSALSPESLARKLRAPMSGFLKLITREGGRVFYQHGPDKKAQLEVGAAAGGEAGGFGAPASTTPALNLPANVSAFARWYSGDAGAPAPRPAVSHRDRQSPVDDQATRGTCTAFASMAAMEALNGKKALSKEYAYWLFKDQSYQAACESRGSNFKKVAQVLRENAIPGAAWYPYLPLASYDIRLCPAGPLPHVKDKKDARAAAVYEIPRSADGRMGAYINNPRFLEAAIDAGHDVIIAVGVAWESKGWPSLQGVLDVVVDDKTEKPREPTGYHAMLAVGYERTDNPAHGGGYVLIKNSWGLLVGDGGYVKLSYDYIRQYGDSGLIIGGLTPGGAAPAVGPVVSRNGKCLDVHGPDFDGRKNGGRVQAWDCHGGDNQKWRLDGDRLILQNGKCLDVHGPDFDAKINGARVQVWDCHGGENQRWIVDGGRLRAGNGKCLDLSGPDFDAKVNGGRVQLWDCHDAGPEQWSVGK